MTQPNDPVGGAEPAPPLRSDETRLVWIDMEMTGLRPDIDRIIEVAAVVTDSDLNVLVESPSFAVHQPDEVLDAMDQWNKSTHGRSGLIDRVRSAVVNEADVERELMAFLAPWVPAGKSPICGNSICQDRRFLVRHMPRLERYFHYRNLDVSTVKELARRWSPALLEGFAKVGAHTALSDIRESVKELAHYRQHMGKLGGH